MSETKVITGIVRLSYANIWEPKGINGGAEKYSASLIIPKTDTKTIAAIETACKAAFENGKTKLGDKTRYEPLKKPLRDGDAERPDDEAYANSYFINATSNEAPGIVDLAKNKIIDRSLVYSGCYIRASLNFFSYNSSGNKGIGCGLNNIQKVKDGTPLGGRGRAETDFDDGFVDGDDFLI